WFCPNDSGCPMQIKGRILHFVGRKAMDILCGEAGIDQFYSAGLASSPADLYSISKLQLVALEGWKEKSAQNFLDSLEKSKSVPFERVLFALGIRYVGETTAKSIAKHFGDIEHIAAASVEELTQIGDVGAVIAESVYAYMHSPVGQEQIERLKAAGLQFAAEADQGPKSDSLSGLSIVVSGNFSIPRDKIKEMIAAHGGKVSSSISSKTSFLLAGEKSGPEKLKKCEQLGIRLVSEAEFMQMIPGEKAVRKEEIIEELTLF
ncbi:MAG: NAD-dependent DNA ligase LigA, partial [Bacteroidales bacterium]|nr:NAD-dependent DNA ligase LigA [Bacteroidales bacterium]